MSEAEADVESRERAEGGNDVHSTSHVYTATEDTLFQQRKSHALTHVLSLDWAFGMNSAVPALILQDRDRLVVFYAGAHVGIIHNHTSNSQYLLQGHNSLIACACASEDRRWIGTADTGQKSMVMIWDSYSGIPVQTLFDCHPGGGIAAMAFSRDTKHLVTLGAEEVQRVCIWDWTNEAEKPLWSVELDPKHGYQAYIMFNPNDSTQLLSNSESQVLLYNTDQGSLQYCGLSLYESICAGTGHLSQCAFHWRKLQVLAVTTAGYLLMWELNEDRAANQNLPFHNLRAIKLPSSPTPITVLTVTERFIVTGDTQGHISFYDEKFILLTKYTEMNLDAIASISFSKECNEEAELCINRNFVVSTVSSTAVYVDTHKGTHQVLLRDDGEAVHAVACHPKQPLVAMGNHRGFLKVWDYNGKVMLCSRGFETEWQIQCVTFDPQGAVLAVGFGSGAVHILNSNTLESEECFQETKDSIQHIVFSADSKYLATADAGKAVTVFHSRTNEGSLCQWTYLGRYGSHYKPIVDLLFGVHLDSTQPRLLSLGMDRRLVEYDLENSEVNKLLILSSERVEQSAVPVCMSWYPPLTAEQSLLVTSDQYKMKLFNSTTKMCRKTLLGPTYDSPVKKVVVLPQSTVQQMDSYYMAFITDDKVGLQILPVDGNPYKSNARICHPTGVSACACSYDGRFVFTAGGTDCIVFSWEINPNNMEAAAALGGKDMMPFYTLLEGGRDGKFYREMEDFFYYCQICHHGADLMRSQGRPTTIPLTCVPDMMRALSHYPTEQEIEDMHNEVKFSKYEETGKYVTDIDLEEFIKLYVNHRPALGLSRDEFACAFHTLAVRDSTGKPVLQRRKLLELLQTRGECMTEQEVAECFTSLLGLNDEEQTGECSGLGHDSLEVLIPEEITMEMFRDHILGFPSFSPPEQSGRSSLPE